MNNKLLIGLAVGAACAIAAYFGIPWQEILQSVSSVMQ
jgi:hypothetical protein